MLVWIVTSKKARQKYILKMCICVFVTLAPSAPGGPEGPVGPGGPCTNQ